MKDFEVWSSRFINSIWSDRNESWEENYVDWRIVGTNPFVKRAGSGNPDPENIQLHIVEFPSKRLDMAYIVNSEKIKKDVHVILEADRGEDCGIIKGHIAMSEWEEFLKRHKSIENDFKLKRIYRIATERDLLLMEERKAMVKGALEECRKQVREMDLKMEILDCEYQFDLNKITFFYKSEERIDFRELVKGLYRIFKTRIWMCSVDKSVDKLLTEILKE